MLESAGELAELQDLMDRSIVGAGRHLRSIVTPERQMRAEELCGRMTGMRLLVVGTATSDGRPLTGPVDGYLLHGSFHFSSARDSVRVRHLSVRPGVSATHLRDEGLAVSVHGRGELFGLDDPGHPELRQAMIDHYLPIRGASFEEWLDDLDAVGVRVAADRLFTFRV